MGGYEQELEFFEDGKCSVAVFGNSLSGFYTVNTSASPVALDVSVTPPGAPPQPPSQYICKIDGEGLHLCCSVTPSFPTTRPSTFDGPGYCLMARGGVPAADESEIAGLSH